MNIKNIFGAYKTTLIGIAITVITSLVQALTVGAVNWKVIGISALTSVLLALTDVLKEQQKAA